MKILVPLYIYPLKDGKLAPEWQAMKDAQESGVSVVAIANPGSGPGTEGDRPPFELGMQALKDSGVQVIGYVPSGYGKLPEDTVKGQICLYKEWYGQWVSGIFLDETSYEADEVAEGDRGMCAKYRRYHEEIKEQLGPSASVIYNTGTMLTEEALIREAGDDIVWTVLENSRSYMETNFGACGFRAGSSKRRARAAGDVTGTPPAAPSCVRGRAAFLMHGSAGLSFEELCYWVSQLIVGGWTHLYLTDKVFDPSSDDPALQNPWNALPRYWSELVRAIQAEMPDGEGKQAKCRSFCCFGA